MIEKCETYLLWKQAFLTAYCALIRTAVHISESGYTLGSNTRGPLLILEGNIVFRHKCSHVYFSILYKVFTFSDSPVLFSLGSCAVLLPYLDDVVGNMAFLALVATNF